VLESEGGSRGTYLGFLTYYAFHLLECLVQSICACLEAFEDGIVFLSVQLITLLALLGRIHHDLDHALANHGRTQHDADELEDLGLDLPFEANEFKEAAAVATLAHHALGDAVQGSKLHVIIQAWLGSLYLAQTLFERVEFTDEDVGLVHLVRHDDQLLLGSQLEDSLDVIRSQARSRRVSWVDDGDAPHIDSLCACLVQGFLDAGEIGAPGLALVQVVGDACGVKY
jgi:hypothetical protein